MNKMLLSLFTCLLLVVAIQAQQAKGQLDIQFNKNILQPGDSLFITMDYKDGGGQILDLPLATLELIVENEQGMRTLLRWPVINGQASRGFVFTRFAASWQIHAPGWFAETFF